MVRETRFAFDDHEHPDDNPREHFTEEDERLLDGFSSPSKTEGSPKPPKRRASRTEKRHLADGDWLDPKKNPPKRGRKVS